MLALADVSALQSLFLLPSARRLRVADFNLYILEILISKLAFPLRSVPILMSMRLFN